MRSWLYAFLALSILTAIGLCAQEPDKRFNIPVKTLGGRQFWADQHVFQGWRIQEHVFTRHFRLLDPENYRRAWGSREHCEGVFEQACKDLELQSKSDHLVVLLHGLGRSRHSLKKMEANLVASGFEVAAVNYPSTRRSIDEHAAQVEKILAERTDVKEVSFVTHSMGGIVVRALLHRKGSWKESIRTGRVVMLAPPSQGSLAADFLKDSLPFQLIAGEAGQQLEPQAMAQLPPPPCSFGIIAGGKGDDKGYNPILPGDDDGVVTVENAKLEEAADFLLVHSSHTNIMNQDEVVAATLSFLKNGSFGKPSERR